MNFNELNLRQEILRAISELGYERATAIQADSIPPILSGHDVTGHSATGTGKTAAFGLPLIQKAAENGERASTLILAPTRELALQITKELHKFSKYLSGISIACVYGGEPIQRQIKALKRARIVVGTPGRIMDHMRRHTLKLANLRTVVLDEADEMLNMGFVDDIRTILDDAPKERQTILFSATLSPDILKITEEFQTDTVFIKADKGRKSAPDITQYFYYLPAAQKIDALKLLLEYLTPSKCLVFCNTKKTVDELSLNLKKSGYRAVGLHGDLRQSQRTTIMEDFRAGHAKILIATDVAARGIDIDDVDMVFNYDLPQELEYYVHRIGRCGRAGRKGESHTLVSGRRQFEQLKKIEQYTKLPIHEEQLPEISMILEHKKQLFAEEVLRLSTQEVSEEWDIFLNQLQEKGISATHLAKLLLSRSFYKNKRLDAIGKVACLPTPKKERRNRFDSRKANSKRSGSKHSDFRHSDNGKGKDGKRLGYENGRAGHSFGEEKTKKRKSSKKSSFSGKFPRKKK